MTAAHANRTDTIRRVSYLTVTFDRIGPVGPTGATTHTVGPRDTLVGIGRRYGVTVADIRVWNGMTAADTISAGQDVRVVPTLPPLTVHVHPHTMQHGKTCPVGEHKCTGKAAHVDAAIAHLTLPVREYVRMSPLVPDTFTVTIGLDTDGNGNLTGTGTVLVNGGRHGRATIAPTDD
jgi:LysM repeat protein